jgi:hypothetical protein
MHSLDLIKGVTPVGYGTNNKNTDTTELTAAEIYFFYLGEDCSCLIQYLTF